MTAPAPPCFAGWTRRNVHPGNHALLASPWSLAGFAVVAEFELRVLFATKANLVSDLVVQPLVYLVLLTAGLQNLIASDAQLDGGNYITYVFPGLLALQAVRAFASTVYRATAERRWGQLALKRLAGVGPLGYVLGMCPPLVLAFVIQAAVSTPLALWLGMSASPLGWLATIVLGSILLLFWSALALLLTTLVRNYQQRDAVVSLLMLPMMFSAPVFFSLADAPRYLQVVAWFNPLTYQVIAMRDAFNGRFDWSIVLIALGCTVAVVLAATASVANSDLLGSERG